VLPHNVFTRTARDQRRSLRIWCVALVGLVGMYIAFYPSIRGNASYTKLIDEMPKAYRALFSVTSGADFTSAVGYLNTELLSFMAPLLVLVYAIGAGSSAIAGEEDRHTLDLLLANPVSRTRVLLEKFAALAGGVAGLMAALWVALVALGAVAGMHAPVVNSAAAVVHLGLLGVEFGALALLTGAVTGHLAASRAVPALLAVVSYLFNGFGQLVSWLRPLRPISPFYAYNGHDPLRSGPWTAGIVIVVLTTAVVVAAAAVAFGRRDVRV
jgi:ABC-2 type transport system permease protein